MELVVVKFGGKSIANNKKLKKAAIKVISFIQEKKKVIAVLSAQGKTTDNLLKQAKKLSNTPNKRELDMLLSVGEQISCSKFAVFLCAMGYKAISLTGWQSRNYNKFKIYRC